MSDDKEDFRFSIAQEAEDENDEDRSAVVIETSNNTVVVHVTQILGALGASAFILLSVVEARQAAAALMDAADEAEINPPWTCPECDTEHD